MKQQMFYQLWKCKLDTLLLIILSSKTIIWYGHPAQSPWRSTTSLFFNVTLYTLLHFWLSTQKSNTNLNDLFYMNIKFDKLLSEIVNVLQKGEFKLTMSA